MRRVAVGYYHPISNTGEWNNCFIKNNQKMLDLVDFILQERPEDDLLVGHDIMANIQWPLSQSKFWNYLIQ